MRRAPAPRGRLALLLALHVAALTSVLAENCGDPLASCYVGNARAGAAEDSRQKYGQSVTYKPTVMRGQRRLDRLESLDTVRLAPGALPLTAAELGEWLRFARLVRFYDKGGVVHLVYPQRWCDTTLLSCRDDPYAPDRFWGNYYAKATDFGEEWVRCNGNDSVSGGAWNSADEVDCTVGRCMLSPGFRS